MKVNIINYYIIENYNKYINYINLIMKIINKLIINYVQNMYGIYKNKQINK